MWQPDELRELYEDRLRLDRSRGVDRVSPEQLASRINEECALISRKVLGGEYRFAPYAQVLRSKGPEKPPREICIPTARDRIALLALKERLHEEFPDHVGRVLPNSMVREALSALAEADPTRHVCLRLDIKDFYGSIEHGRLSAAVGTRLTPFEARLVTRAVERPAVPTGSRRSAIPRRRRQRGVPQGLAISNVLADVYLGDFDEQMASECVSYFRFVDDMMFIVEANRVGAVYDRLSSSLESLGLESHPLEPRSAKGGQFGIDERIEFLGYIFDGDYVTVRQSSVDRFLEKMAARMARYRRDKQRLSREPEWMTADLLLQVLFDELNERISGAISESRRYGWMFYFSATTDEALLFEMDAALRSMLVRLAGVKPNDVRRMKRLARAHHEVKHRPTGRFVQNYDQYTTMAQRLEFIGDRGLVGPDQFLSEERVNELFERYRRQQLRELEADIALVS